MSKYRFRPEDEHREEIISIFLTISGKKKLHPPFVTRSEIESEIVNNPGKYQSLNQVTKSYRRIVISKVMNSDHRSEKNTTWQKAWAPTEKL